MTQQHLETQNEPEAETLRHALSPASTEEEIATPQPPTEAEIHQLVYARKAKASKRWFRGRARLIFTGQGVKAKELDSLLEMEFDDVLTVLRQESQQRTKRQKIFTGIFLGVVLLFVLFAIFTRKLTMLSQMGSYVGLIAMGTAASQQQKVASMVIARFNDVRAVGPLTEALEFKDPDTVQIATKALISLLPRLKASDAPLLSPTHRHSLNKALQGKNTELTLAILKAWEQVGDAGAVSEVEKLVEGRGRGGRISKVVEAAKDCLPFLRQSAERQQIGSQLLRPSDGNLTPSDVLLRPAMPHTSTEPPGELLRPTNNVAE
jgi:hypothetical protein